MPKKNVSDELVNKTLHLELELLMDSRVLITLEENYFKRRDIVGQVQAMGIYTYI